MHEKNWTGLLAQIRKRPGMYLGSTNLQVLGGFIQGFRTSEDIYSVPEQRTREINDFPWVDFETFVANLYNERRLSLNSFGLAQFTAQGRNLGAFDSSLEYHGAWEIWWQWLDEFAHTDLRASR